MNRVIVQVRPFGDAIYKSKYFPWSKYISGKQGRNPGFDPLKIMVEQQVLRIIRNLQRIIRQENGMPRSLQEEMYFLMVEVCITTHPKKRSEH